jgi:hypothetical protein
MTEMSHEIAVLFWLVAAALVGVVAAIVALIRSGRTVPPFAETTPRAPRPKRAAKRNGPLVPLRNGRS